MSKNLRKSVFTKKNTIFALFKRNGLKLDTTILNGMQTLCDFLGSNKARPKTKSMCCDDVHLFP